MLSKKKREQRAKLVADARVITDAIPEGGAMSAEDNAKFDTIMKAADGLKAEIDRLERLEAAEDHLGQRQERRAGREAGSFEDAEAKAEKKKAKALQKSAFNHYLRFGMNDMPAELRAIAVPRFQNALGTGNDAAGGYTVPEGFYGSIEDAQLAFGGMLETAYTFTTTSGNDLPIPTDNDTTNEGAILGENTVVSPQDLTFGAVRLGAHTYTSKIVLVANQLLQDSAFDLNTFLADKLSIRLSRVQNRHFTVGSGASQPLGGANAATLGVSAASATVIAPDECIDLAHSVDPAYRPNARYMMADSTLRDLKKKKDGQGRYLWTSGLAFKEPDTLNGFPYTINQHMAAVATGNKSLMFGDFKKYFIRRVAGLMVLRLVERYADANQTGFVAFQRCDGNLIDAGTHPLKYLQNA